MFLKLSFGILLNLFIVVFGQENSVPVRKCCLENEVFNILSKSCENPQFNDNKNVTPNYNVFSGYSVTPASVEFKEFGFLPCNPNYDLISMENEQGQNASFLVFDDKSSQNILENLQLVDVTNNIGYDNHISPFCLDKASHEGTFFGTVAGICKIKDDFCQKNVCIYTCCDINKYFNNSLGKCQHYVNPKLEENSWNPKMLKNDGVFLKRPLQCEEYQPFDKREKNIDFLYDGSVSIEGQIYPYDQYCVSYVEDFNGNEFEYWIQIDACRNGSITDSHFKRWKKLSRNIDAGFTLTSLMFLGLLFVYLWVDQRNKLFGCMMLSAILMLFIFYLLLSIKKLSSSKHNVIVCTLEGYSIQFSYMSAVFWLNAMSYMAWTTFKQIRMPAANRLQSNVKKLGIFDPKYKWYAFYSWGCPLLVSIVTFGMQNLPEDFEKYVILPKIGEKNCFFSSNSAKLYYFHIINGPILVANSVFFILFLWNMCCGVYAHGGTNLNQSINDQNKKRFKAILKMAFIMGISWIAEIISFYITWQFGHESFSHSKIIFGFKIFNALQGFFMFCVIYFDSSRLEKIWSKIICCHNNQQQPKRTFSQSQSTVCTTQTSMKSTKIISSMKKLKAKEEAIEIS